MLLNVVTPVFLLAGFANDEKETVGRIGILIESLQIRLGMIQMADVVLGRILRAARVEQLKQRMLEGEAVVALLHHVVLMEDVAEEMTVVELVEDLGFHLRR